ncbi:hypothetical protein C2G38_2033402 [Gigaspora rosea]|uniref:Uncharacterized protein n=1 Tax=Gigaspora rosea TaxID=44941 RepID=A0A397VMV4_9GLOM|nr:hypothetical protein C2G38_2033402 [Gigaspora rosea]
MPKILIKNINKNIEFVDDEYEKYCEILECEFKNLAKYEKTFYHQPVELHNRLRVLEKKYPKIISAAYLYYNNQEPTIKNTFINNNNVTIKAECAECKSQNLKKIFFFVGIILIFFVLMILMLFFAINYWVSNKEVTKGLTENLGNENFVSKGELEKKEEEFKGLIENEFFAFKENFVSKGELEKKGEETNGLIENLGNKVFVLEGKLEKKEEEAESLGNKVLVLEGKLEKKEEEAENLGNKVFVLEGKLEKIEEETENLGNEVFVLEGKLEKKEEETENLGNEIFCFERRTRKFKE